ncbi:MAG: helix-turn-helix transcriptional regulator, partial [Candidatus Berkelbacteria bacterium]|nr:helix-turn-helix transcriptional regulator [Candidatus Berkelbacteria bacterium]
MDSRLKNLREMIDFTQEELAREIGISRQSLISLERGKCKPSIDLARAISDFF